MSKKNVCGVAHVVLAPDDIQGGARVTKWGAREITSFISRSAKGDFWYFGKPTAYAGRRMGLVVAFHENIERARKDAETIAHFAEKQVFYGES